MRPLEPADTTLPRSPEQRLLPSGELVDRASPADQLGREGAPEVDHFQAGEMAERRQSEDLPEVGITTGSLARASSGVDTRMTPRLLLNPAPIYPSDALARRLEGTVILQVAVDASGGVTEVKLVRSSRVPSLDEAAQSAVRQWSFLPARDPNTPVRRVNIPIEFTIRDR
jgi:periplasmic protein TonB